MSVRTGGATHHELRQSLIAEGDKVVRTAAVLMAAETNDLELLLAVQDPPRGIYDSIITDKEFEKAKRRWLGLNRAR